MSKSLLGLFVAVLFVLGFSAGIANAGGGPAGSIECDYEITSGPVKPNIVVPEGEKCDINRQ